MSTVSQRYGSRLAIGKALLRLAEDLGEFEQTTHGCLGPFDIESVAQALVDCYLNPGAYQVSELSQKIVGFIPAQK